ncbi:MAG: UDP-N-acetylglucosamine 2-epimerase (hydrolyzing) [Eubacterium sp.]|nr:UDP-N-acetylglucosamine 2-epimerase (hydrolyzing) [Eubacterium sp.]
MSYKICVVTTTRADYGIFRPLLKRMQRYDFDITIAVGGTHFCDEYGYTVDEIKADDFAKTVSFDYLKKGTTPRCVTESAGRALSMFSDILEENRYDLIILLGDRYETLAIAEAALIYRIPVAHLHGGEITEGAIDDSIRHAITKLSNLHFTSTEEHRKRIIQLGENPDRVFCVGALGVESILNQKLLSKEELSKELGMKFDKPYILMTYHPVTVKNDDFADDFGEVLSAVKDLSDYDFIITKANADSGGEEINKRLEDFSESFSHVYLFDSLGSLRYLSAMKNASLVFGNSSSGIIEAPSLKIPTVNIGDRQKGRMHAGSVIDTPPEKMKIIDTVRRVIELRNSGKLDYTSPYGDGSTSVKICDILTEILEDSRILYDKRFYDIL